MSKRQRVQSVAIMGPGRIGQAMGRLLAAAGVPIAFVAGRSPSAVHRAARFIGQGKPITLCDSDLASAGVFLITTSDGAVAEVASQLAKLLKGADAWRGKVVLHTCGSLPSAVLLLLKNRGAAIGSLHPYQTVPSPQAGERNLRGCYWAIEGDLAARRLAGDWVRRLGGIAFPIRPEHKTLYHLSAFIVSPTVVTLMAEAEALLKQAKIPARIARPMLRQFVAETAKNFSELGGRRALTGPAVRGDWATIRRHLATLRRADPQFLTVYQSLLNAMQRLAGSSSEAKPPGNGL